MKPRAFIIGGFNKTKYLAASLIKKGYKVTAINTDGEKCAALAEWDKLTVFNGDGSMPFILEDADVYNADIVIALTDKDEDNLVACQLCKRQFNVKRTVSMVSDPKKTEFFYKMGIDSVVCAVSTLASVIEQQTFMDEMSTLASVGDGKIKIVRLTVGESAPAVGKRLMEIHLPKQVIVGCLLRGDLNIIPRGDTRIYANDIVVLIASGGHEKAAARELTGNAD